MATTSPDEVSPFGTIDSTLSTHALVRIAKDRRYGEHQASCACGWTGMAWRQRVNARDDHRRHVAERLVHTLIDVHLLRL